jgi:alpha-ketoglutarate-dependent taurine dioxygenase
MTITGDFVESTLTAADEPLAPGLQLRHLSGSIGTEIRGLDLSLPLPAKVVAAVRRVWLERKVVFFPAQHLTPEQHCAFAAQFGEITPAHPVIAGIEGHPEVFEIDYSKSRELYEQYGDVATRSPNAVYWHTDVTFVKRPPIGSILNAVVIPEAGGDTQWSNQAAAFAGLSERLQLFLSTLTAVHDGRRQFSRLLEEREGGGEWEKEVIRALEPVEHPVVRTHSETRERVLFVNPGFTSHIKELSRAESDHLLEYLYAHSVQPEYTVRYKWSPGTIGFWDNRATQHSVVGDFGSAHRVIQRVTLRGEEPR